MNLRGSVASRRLWMVFAKGKAVVSLIFLETVEVLCEKFFSIF